MRRLLLLGLLSSAFMNAGDFRVSRLRALLALKIELPNEIELSEKFKRKGLADFDCAMQSAYCFLNRRLNYGEDSHNIEDLLSEANRQVARFKRIYPTTARQISVEDVMAVVLDDCPDLYTQLVSLNKLK